MLASLSGRDLSLAGLAVRFGAQAIGLLAVATPIATWCVASRGYVVGSIGSRAELAACVALLAVATWFGMQQAYPLQSADAGIITLTLLSIVAMRYPLRILAPIAATLLIAYGICWLEFVGPRSADGLLLTPDVLAIQNILFVALLGVLTLSSIQNTRRLAADRLLGYAQELAREEEGLRRDSAGAAREGIAQALVGVRFGLGQIARLEMPTRTREALAEVVELVRLAESGADLTLRELGPQGLEDVGLAGAVEAYVDRLRAGTPADIACSATGNLAEVPVPVRRLVFRVVSELLKNALVHANATSVSVVLAEENGTVSIRVTDDGVGFVPEVVLRDAARSRSGLRGVRNRVLAEGGTFVVRSTPGAGCYAEVRVSITPG